MSSHHAQPSTARSRLATIGVVVAVVAVLLAFFAQGLASFLALVALAIGVVVLVRSWRAGTAKGPGIGTVVAAFVALLVVGLTSPAPAPPVAPVAAGPALPDPNALPASVLIASAQTPDNLVTNAGRRLHVTMMQGYATPDACRTGVDRATADELVSGKQVTVAAPDPARLDAPTAVPAGFQPVVLTLPDGRDYAQAWVAAARDASASCTTTTTTPAPTTTEEPVPTTTVEEQPDVDADVDRPYAPSPRTKERSGGSGHPCLPGERDGDGDGYCGE